MMPDPVTVSPDQYGDTRCMGCEKQRLVPDLCDRSMDIASV